MQRTTKALFYFPEAQRRRFERGGTEFNEGRPHKRFEYGYLTEPSQAPSRLSDLEVRVKFLLENPPCKEGQPPDILLNRHFVPKKDPKSVFFLREAEFQQPV